MKKSDDRLVQRQASAPLCILRVVLPMLYGVLLIMLCEWAARGTLEEFWESSILLHTNSYLLAWMFLVISWCILDGLFHFAPLAFFLTGCLAVIPGIINYYTLQLRGEPFLPWDLAQVGEATGVIGAAGVIVQPNMIAAGIGGVGRLVFSLPPQKMEMAGSACRAAGSGARHAGADVRRLSPPGGYAGAGH